jgi:hypothetical protein
MMEDGLLEQGRLVKDSAGCMFYDPAALVAFCRFNFLLRRAFIRMLHADLTAVREAINTLEEKGVKTVDCRRAGFSAAETTSQLRSFCENWRQPFQKYYTQSSVTRAFEQLLAVRADLEEALGQKQPQALGDSPPPVRHKASRPAAATAETKSVEVANARPPMEGQQPPPVPAAPERKSPRLEESPAPNVNPAPAASHKTAKPVSDVQATPTGAAEAEKCLEAIWEQLIAAPPSRGRSMSTVVLQDTKVLLSSWEVAAFVSEGGQESEDLRRVVGGRHRPAEAVRRRDRACFRACAGAKRGFLLPGPRRTSQAIQEYGSCRKSRNQHQAATLLYGRSGKTSVLSRRKEGLNFDSIERPDRLRRHRVRADDRGSLAG